MRKYAAFEKKTGRSAKSQKWRKTLAKHGILTHRKAFERYDKNPIRLPRKHISFYHDTDYLDMDKMAKAIIFIDKSYVYFTIFDMA